MHVYVDVHGPCDVRASVCIIAKCALPRNFVVLDKNTQDKIETPTTTFAPKRALGRSQLFPPPGRGGAIMSIILLNLSWGPWSGEAWFARLREESANYLSLANCGDAIFLWLTWLISQQDGRPETAGIDSAGTWSDLIYPDFLLRKGQRILLTRWGAGSRP